MIARAFAATALAAVLIVSLSGFDSAAQEAPPSPPSGPVAIYDFDGLPQAAANEAFAKALTWTIAWEANQAAHVAHLEARWIPLHNCENPGTWTVDGVFGNGLHGGGGLGISNGAWHEWGGDQYASRPGAATPLQQMEVAEVGFERYGGGSPWGCPVS